MDDNLEFFITTMPDTRPADYYLGCFEGSVFIGFNNYGNELICLKRISFDGYGCYDLNNESVPMDKIDSQIFKEQLDSQLSNQLLLTKIIKKTISNNSNLIGVEALKEYGLL